MFNNFACFINTINQPTKQTTTQIEYEMLQINKFSINISDILIHFHPVAVGVAA